MKKSAIVLLHAGYWLLYLILIAFFIQVMPNLHRPPLFTELFLSQPGLFALLPGLLGFYSFYLILFPRYLKRKKIPALFFFAFAASLCSGLATLLMLSLLFDFKWYA